ncbi:MAG: FtsX-like permease family protein [Acidobacteria bacterium]|nr:FtsX-like permease family protein [Acidobacteriota bacterium]
MIISISFSLMLLSLMITIWRSFYLDTLGTTSALRLVTRPRGASFSMLVLPSYYEKKIRAVRGVVDVARCNLFAGLYRNERSENAFAQIGTDPRSFLDVHPDYKIAAYQAASWESDPAGAIADRALAEKYGWKLGDRLLLRGSTVPVNLELIIRGIYDAPVPTQSVIFNWDYVEQSDSSISGLNNLYLVLTDSPESINRVAADVDALFRNSTEPTRTETEKAFELEFLEMLGNVKGLIATLGMAALFTTALVSANTMAMSIRERMQEIAVLRTLGFNRKRVVALCIAESIALSSAGALVAAFSSYCLLFVIAHFSEWRLYSGVLRITPLSLLLLLATAALIGVLSAVIPSYRATRIPIAKALRHTG